MCVILLKIISKLQKNAKYTKIQKRDYQPFRKNFF